VSVTAGTIFHRTRTPLTIWFAAAWYVTSAKNGVSAKTLHRLLGFGSYQTAWTMLHRFRTAMVRPGRDRLAGEVEVDETFIGGIKPGKRGRGARGKALVAVAVESLNPKGFGRCRLRTIPDAEAPTLRSFVLDCVEPGSVLVTDGFASYPRAIGDDYGHRPFTVAGSGVQAHVVLPGVHRVASLVKRWLLGTHQGAVGGGPPPSLPRRVCVPVQPAPLRVPGSPLQATPRTGGPSGPGHLPVPCCKPVPQAYEASSAQGTPCRAVVAHGPAIRTPVA
jgi:ISXO2-like transposase domain